MRGAAATLVRVSGSRKAEAGKGNAPGRMKPKRARDTTRGEIRRWWAPTGRGMKPLKRSRSGSNAYCAEGAKHHRSKEGQVLIDLFDEFVLVTANLWGGAKQKQALVSVLRFANRRRGCPAERRWRSLSGNALKGSAPRARLVEKTPGSSLRE